MQVENANPLFDSATDWSPAMQEVEGAEDLD